MATTIELFVQGEGIPRTVLLRMPGDAVVRDVVDAAEAHGLVRGAGPPHAVWREDEDRALPDGRTLADVEVGNRASVHVHRCHIVNVTVNFGARSERHPFPPSTTVRRVKQWADQRFRLEGQDATDHMLQLCGQSTRPDEDVHLGTLVVHPSCELCFDLVPKVRVEG